MTKNLSILSLRNFLYTLIPANQIHQKVYDRIRRALLIHHEGRRLTAYDDATGVPVLGSKSVLGNVTVGVGFNMDAPGARSVVTKILPHLNFDAIYRGKQSLSETDSDILLTNTIRDREQRLSRLYDGIFHSMPLNERLSIEDAFFNLESLVSAKTRFYSFIQAYYKTRKKSHLEQAAFELEHRSNGGNLPGIQRRRHGAAALLRSYECPSYGNPTLDGAAEKNNFFDLFREDTSVCWNF